MVKEEEERAPPQDRPGPDPPGQSPLPSPQPSDDEDDQPRQVPQPQPNHDQDDIDSILRDNENRLNELNELNIPQEDLRRVALMLAAGGSSGGGSGGGGARRRRVVKKPWKGWRIFVMKLFMIVALMPGIPMMPKIQTNQPTKYNSIGNDKNPPESVLQRFRRVVVNNFHKGDNKSNDEEESLCIATKKPTLTFKPTPGLIKPKTLRQLKCRGKDTYYSPSTNNQLTHKILDTNAEIVPILKDMFALAKPSKQLFEELNDDAFDMCASGNENVIYWVPLLKKIGWVRNSCKAKGDRYANYDVHVLFSFSKSDEKVIEALWNHLRKLYDVISEIGKDWEELTGKDIRDYQDKYGITPWLKISLQQVIQRGAGKKRGILPNVFPMLVESAAQWYWKDMLDSKFSVHEWLHTPCRLFDHTHDGVSEYLENDYKPSMSEFVGQPINTINFSEDLPLSVSWPPHHDMTEEKLHLRPTDEGLATAINEVNKLEQEDDLDRLGYLYEGMFGITVSSQDVSTIKSGGAPAINLLKNKISSLDEPEEGKAYIVHATHGLYDKILKKWGSKEKGMWVDPIPKRQGQVWKYDATQIPTDDRRTSRFNIKSAVMKMQTLHGPPAEAKSNARYKLVDLCYECFKDATKEEKFDQMMKELKFQQVSKLGEMFISGHRNKFCQSSFVIAHRPFSSAFKSRPPYERAFSDQEWEDHSESAREFCVVQAIRKYHQDPSQGFQVETKMIHSLPIIFEYKLYLTERWHFQYQGAVILLKDILFYDHPDIHPLSPKYGLENVHLTNHIRNLARSSGNKRHDHLVGWKAIIILSWHLDDIDKTARLIHDNLLKTNLNGNPRPYFEQLALMITARKKYFRNNSKAYKQVLTVIEAGINEMKKERMRNSHTAEAVAKRASSNEMTTFNKHWSKIQRYARDENNYETLDDGERVFVVPRRLYSDTYMYLANLRRADDDDWRLKLLKDAGMSMDRYEEAREKRKQDFAQPFDEAAKKARSNNGFANDDDSDEDL